MQNNITRFKRLANQFLRSTIVNNFIIIFCVYATLVLMPLTIPYCIYVARNFGAVLVNLNISEIIKNAALLSASYVGVMGVNTWKRKLKGNQDYTLSKALLILVNKYKNTLCLVRQPFIWPHELPRFSSEELQGVSEKKKFWKEWVYVYAHRWRKLQEHTPLLYELSLEAKVLWPELPITVVLKNIYELEQKLHLELLSFRQTDPDVNNKFDYDNFMLRDSMTELDIFRNELDGFIMELEELLQPKLKL